MRRGIRVEYGIITIKISYYDVLVITNGINKKRADMVLDNVEDLFFAGKDFERDTPVEFINDDIKDFNKFIKDNRYFYTQIKQEGIILYNSGKYKLSRRRKLNFAEIKNRHRSILMKNIRKQIYSSNKQYSCMIKKNTVWHLLICINPAKTIFILSD